MARSAYTRGRSDEAPSKPSNADDPSVLRSAAPSRRALQMRSCAVDDSNDPPPTPMVASAGISFSPIFRLLFFVGVLALRPRAAHDTPRYSAHCLAFCQRVIPPQKRPAITVVALSMPSACAKDIVPSRIRSPIAMAALMPTMDDSTFRQRCWPRSFTFITTKPLLVAHRRAS